MLSVFRCPAGKKIVVSDSTVPRVLHWFDQQQSRTTVLAPLNAKGLLRRRLSPQGNPRRLGIIDGSEMGGHYLVPALLTAPINYPVLAEPCKGRGHELKTAQRCLPALAIELSLAVAEARETAHLRRQIENNQFKRQSHLGGTKKVYFKDQACFFSLLRPFFLALAAFNAFFYMLHKGKTGLKALMQGCKLTWKAEFLGCGNLKRTPSSPWSPPWADRRGRFRMSV